MPNLLSQADGQQGMHHLSLPFHNGQRVLPKSQCTRLARMHEWSCILLHGHAS